MSALRDHLRDYLELRRSLGFKLVRDGQFLAGFVSYLDSAGAACVTTEHALAWATAPADGDPTYWRHRLGVTRSFARYLVPLVPGTEVPPRGLLPGPGTRRAVPYLYSAAEVTALISAAGQIRSPLRAASYQTLIGLLAVTGLRVGEAIGLDRGDVDLDQQLLTVRDSKGKSRQVPLHPSAVAALAAYARLRDTGQPRPAALPFFVSLAGTRLIYKNVHCLYHRLTQVAGLAPRSRMCRPRIHDLRHTFAVNAITGWYADGGSIDARMPLLSAWLGHASPAETYWYLTGTPELLALAAARLEQHGGQR
jgi:integrase/recombinase XerD